MIDLLVDFWEWVAGRTFGKLIFAMLLIGPTLVIMSFLVSTKGRNKDRAASAKKTPDQD